MGQSRSLFAYFHPYLIPISNSTIQNEKSIDGVLGFEPGPQDCGRWLNPGAMVAVNFTYNYRILLTLLGIFIVSRTIERVGLNCFIGRAVSTCRYLKQSSLIKCLFESKTHEDLVPHLYHRYLCHLLRYCPFHGRWFNWSNSIQFSNCHVVEVFKKYASLKLT